MNTLTTIKRRVQAAYKTRPHQTRASKRRDLRDEAEDSLRASEYTEASMLSTIASTPSMSSHFEDVQTSSYSQQQQSKAVPGHECIAEDDSSVRFADAEDDSEMPPREEVPSQQLLESLQSPDTSEESNCAQQRCLDAEIMDQQALRNKVYAFSNGEEPEDYTDGPVRLVIATDGVKHCAALLLTYDFSGRVQNSLRAQRDFAKADRAATRQLEVALNFEISLGSEIANHNSRLEALNDEENVDLVEEETIRAELYVLEEMLKTSEIDRQRIQSNLESRGNILREIQEETNAYLEDAFVYARLVEPEDTEADTPIEERNLEKEYQEFRRLLGMDSSGSVVPLDTNRDHLTAAIEPMTAEQELQQAVWAAYDRLQSAQVAFDRRVADRVAEHQANLEAATRGGETIDATPEEFDLRWLKREQDLTHELIEAEAALSDAKAAAVEAGIDVPIDDKASGFVDDVADGYRMSKEQDCIASVPSPKVKSWLSEIPEVVSPSFNERFEEGDEWEAEDVEISDSVSVVAAGAERRRIDKWRQVCGL